MLIKSASVKKKWPPSPPDSTPEPPDPPAAPEGRLITQAQECNHFETGLWFGIHDALSRTQHSALSADEKAAITRSMVKDLLHTCIVLLNANPYDIEHREHCDIKEEGRLFAAHWADHTQHRLSGGLAGLSHPTPSRTATHSPFS